MGKTTENKHVLRLSQTKMVLEIQQNPDFHDSLLNNLNDKKHLIHTLCTQEPVKRLQTFLKQQLKSQIALLETYFTLEPQKATVTQEQKIQCDIRLMKLLEIIKLLYKNDDFYNDDDKNLPLFNKLMCLTDNFEVITKLIGLLMNTSFQKTEKEFFYHIYFLCDHVDIYDLKDTGIKQVYEIGKKIREFRFYFVQQNKQSQILIGDFYQFIWQNNLVKSHYRKVTSFILQMNKISMDEKSMTYLALLSKVKLYLKAVKFNNDGTVENDGNPIVQAVAYANAMYCYIEYFVLGQEITQHCSIPNIFSFPPAYSEIFKELLEIFLLQESNKETHLIIMKSINEILELQQKTSAVDIVGRLNDNSSLIYKYLSYAKNYLENEEYRNQLKGKINLEAFSLNEFVLQFFKIMLTQVQQTHQLNSIACWIVEKIFKKETIFTYNDEVVNQAGNLLVSIQYEEQKLMKVIIQKVDTHPEGSKPYLRVLNDLFSKKSTRMIQRRDLTYVARESSESCILVRMESLIKKEIEFGNIQRDSFLMETIQLISSICEQSPTLIDSIQKTSSTLIPYLLDLISGAASIPSDINSLTDVINFLHHISLRDGPIRNTMLKKPMISFITKILTMDRFVETLSRNVKSVGGYIVGSLNRFINNIKLCGKYIFSGFIMATLVLNQQYKACSLSNYIQDFTLQGQNSIYQKVLIQSDTVLKLLKCDSKLNNLLKIIQKTSSTVLKKFNSRSLYMLLRPLLQINFQRDNVFLDGSLEYSLLKNIINQTITTIKQYNQMMDRKQKNKLELPVVNELLQSIEEEPNESVQSEQQVERIENQENQPGERLVTENSQQPIQEEGNQQPQQNQQINNNENLPNDQQEDSQISRYRRYFQSEGSESQNLSVYEQAQRQNKTQQKIAKTMELEEKQDFLTIEKDFFKNLTWQATKQLIQRHETMSKQLIQQLYVCFDNLDKFIIPVLQNQSTKQAVLKHMCQNPLLQEVQKQTIQCLKKSEPSPEKISFNILNLGITIYSSKLERMLKFMLYNLNLENKQFNQAEFENVIQRFNSYLRFYLQLVSQSNARNIEEFIKNNQVKYLETSKLPLSRVETKTMDIENLKRNLQIQLNDRWTLFNVLYDSFLKLLSASLSSAGEKTFMTKPEGRRYFQLVRQTVLQNLQDYLSSKILPVLKRDISIRDFQRYRQSIKGIMDVFALNQTKSSMDKSKSDSSILITLYLHSYDPSKENVPSLLAKLLAQQQNQNEDESYATVEDNVQNRWRQVKKVFYKMTYIKFKQFLNQTYSDQQELRQLQQNLITHPDYENQMKKNYFMFYRIHGVLCTFLENIMLSRNKNSYLRDLLLFNSSQFGSFNEKIIKHSDLIYVNYLFEDDHQKQLTETEFYKKIIQRNEQLMSLILQNIDSTVVYYIPMIFRAIFFVQRTFDLTYLSRFNEKIKKIFYDVSKSINQVHFNLTGQNMSLDFPLPRKYSTISQSQFKMDEEAQSEVDLKKQVIKVNNILALIIEFIKYFKTYKQFGQGYPNISSNYVKSMVDFASFFLSNFEVEIHFPQQGDELVISIIKMVEEFISYKQIKQEYNKEIKASRQKQRHTEKKKKFKHLKKRGKDFDKDSVSNSNQIEDFSASQNIPPKKNNKDKSKSQKSQKKSHKSSFKPHKRQKPDISSKIGKQKKTKKKQQHQGLLQNEQTIKGSVLNRSVTDFLKISLAASHTKSYLTARTIQLIINFLQKFSKDVVIRSQSDIQNIKNGKKLQKFKNKFFVYGSEVFGDLLQVKLRNQKLQGFFYLISHLGMRLMTEPHVKIDFECAIKRYFYQRQTQNGAYSAELNKKYKNIIRFKQFLELFEKVKIKDYSELSYLLCFVEETWKKNNQNDEKGQEKQHQQYEIHEFTTKNFKRLNTQERFNAYVKLKNPQQLDVISLPSIKRKKPAHNQDENKKVRFYEYHPQGDFAALTCQIINNIIKIVLNQIVETLEPEKTTQQDSSLKVFNLKILLYSLQIFCRQSPTIVPWIARFKCKKILINELKRHRLSNENLAYKKIVSYVYGSDELQIQNFQEVSFLTLLVKLVYPVSQISTFLFELCLDNNVLMKDKSVDKIKEVKDQGETQNKKCVPFGSIIRQKIVWELQNQLTINKNFDQKFIKNGFTNKEGCLMMKKIASMGLITILISIREFAKLCIEGNLIKRIQEQYLRTSKIVRQLCLDKQDENLPLSSSIMRNFLINYFMRPMQMLQQLWVQYQLSKKQSQSLFKRMWCNSDRINIKFLLDSESINDQLFDDDIFFKTKFKSEWFYANNLEGDEPLGFQDHFDERSDSMDDQESQNMSDIFNEDNSQPPLDREIQEQEEQRSISMSGQEIISQEQGSQEEPAEWYGSQDPFDRESNTFENFILYPQNDYVLENGQQDDQQDLQEQESDLDLDEQLDSYDDSEEGLQEGLEIDLSSGNQQMMLPIFENEVSDSAELLFGQNHQQGSDQLVVPQVGIYYYYIPEQPERRDHANHVCNNPSKLEIKLIQNLYEIFMDVVSFEDIKITNKMVKLQNQQAKLIRKVFKITAYRQNKNKQKLHNLHILQLENQYYEQLYQIFTIDSIFFVSERIDFKQCQRVTYFLQSFPIHYADMFIHDPQVYFSELTKAGRNRRRGMFLSSNFMDRIRRVDQYHQRNIIGRPFRPMMGVRSQVVRPSRFIPGQVALRQIQRYNRENEAGQNGQRSSSQEESEIPLQIPQQNGQLNLIEFNVENPNGGVINVSANLNEILRNMGMSERQFFSLPQDAQSDIMENSLQSQLQNGQGVLNNLFGRIFQNGQGQAPNVSPVLQPQALGENQQGIEQINQLNEPSQQIQMPEQFQMQEQNQQDNESEHMDEEGAENPDTPIQQIIRNENEDNIPQNDALPERYRQISLKHSQKISKDITETLNKDHKNDLKFPQISQELLEEILETIFILENKDFGRFPYSLLGLNMINSKSSCKIISSLMALLCLYPKDFGVSSMIEDKQYGEELIKSRIQRGDSIPKLSLRTYLYEISKDYENEIYPNISIKLLHILQSLTNNYSISMQMLNTNNNPIKILEKYTLSQSKQQTYLSSFQTLIRLLTSKTIYKSPIIVDQILKITNNIMKHYFEKNIFSIHQQHKQLKESKKNIQQSQKKIQAEGKAQVSILPVSLEHKQQVGLKQTHKDIELSELSIELLCSLLMSDELSESKNLSQLIMKLSINGKNLLLFLKNIEAVLQKLCEKSINFLNKQMNKMDNQQKIIFSNLENSEFELENLKKLFCLLEIFTSMIKEFKQFAYRHHIDRYDFIMQKFKGIIQSKSLFNLCETIASIISSTGQNNDLIKNSPQIFEIFFVVFSINIQLATKNGEDNKFTATEKDQNKIASLGEINQWQNGQGRKIDQSSNAQSLSLIQNSAFYKLWNQKICCPNGRIVLNSAIKRKLSTTLKRKRQMGSGSLFDIPMIKIIISTPHLIDFENKRALFRAEMKRIKRKYGSEDVIYMSLDRKLVFQQSFNIIMDKKPQALKNRVKIDFEGQEGQDAGGLTRQWYQLLSTQIFNPNYGLFRPSSTGTTYQPSSTSYVNSQHLNYFKFIGRIMGKALFDGFMLDAYFTPAFYKHILKIPITYLDMQEEDYEYFNSLKWILNNSPIQDYLQLDFTYQFDNFGELKTKELIPNGADVQVTEENKWKYVQLICYAKMATAVQAQLQKFLEGLHEVVPHKYLKIFDPKELQIMISGLPTIDINDLKRNTMLLDYQKTDEIIIWLFEVLEDYDMSLRTAFLQFVSGTSKVPPEGFKGLMGLNGPQRFTIQKQFDIKNLPRAHTCFNQLDLPPYPTKEILRQKLTYAITEGREGFGII